MVMARSKPEPRLGSDAGMRLAVILRRLSGMPEFCAADRIRSLASFSEASGKPRITKAGRVWPMSASTSTMYPLSPTSATEYVLPRATYPTP